MDGGLGRLDEFEALRNCEFDDFIEFVARGEFGRVRGPHRAGFKLQIAGGRKCGGIAHRRASRICYGLVGLRVLSRGGLRNGWLRLARRRPRGERGKKRKNGRDAQAAVRHTQMATLPETSSDAHRTDVISRPFLR